MFASVFLETFSITDLFKDQIFFTLIVSLVSTYLLWFIVSLLFFDPWHMFTSFLQYLALTPTYINILNVYAFCNVHDVTWGTKGDSKVEELPSANVKADKGDVTIPTDDADLNQQYLREVCNFAPNRHQRSAVCRSARNGKTTFRSSVVLIWIGCNIALVVVVLTIGVKVP
jgi:chitin synthase